MRLAAALLLLCGTHALTATGPQPVVWSLAGSDSSAGAGVEADLRAFRCLGARGCAVVTALTAQSTTGVEAVLETPAAHVEATIAGTLESTEHTSTSGGVADANIEESTERAAFLSELGHVEGL